MNPNKIVRKFKKSLAAKKAHPAGTVIQAHDRQYIVAPNGSWRVLNYDKAPVKVEASQEEVKTNEEIA